MKLKEYLVVFVGAGALVYLMNLAGQLVVTWVAPGLGGAKLAIAQIIGNAIVLAVLSEIGGGLKQDERVD